MQNFQDILNKINIGAQIAAAVQPALVQFSADHVSGTQQILQIAGASVAAESSDPQIQAEAAAAATLASSLVPLAFSLFSLFRKKPAAPAVIPSPAAQPAVK